jgi:hypothetical protein
MIKEKKIKIPIPKQLWRVFGWRIWRVLDEKNIPVPPAVHED